jgi:hypothetical protein
MSEPSPAAGGDPGGEKPQQVAHNPTSARVPERVARGVVATGALIYFGQNEFVLDFIQVIARPAHLAARVIMAPPVAEGFLAVLRENLGRYTAAHGTPHTLPKNPQERPRTPAEIYDDLKVSDEQLSGVYITGALVGHTPAEFGIDFITSFFPTAVVSARVYMAAPRVPLLIETLSGLVAQYHKQREAAAKSAPQPPGQNPPGGYGTAPGVPGFPTPPAN